MVVDAWPGAWRGAPVPSALRALVRCPPGAYLPESAAAAATAKLHAHWDALLRLGYRPRATYGHSARRSVRRGFVTYESPLWPRPAHCFESADAVGPRLVRDEPPGTCEPDGQTCDKYRVSRAYRFVWHHVWKVATTTLSPYLSCNFDALPVGGLLRSLPAPLPGYLQVGTAREPLKRFVSAVQEVYLRVRIRPNGTRCLHRKVPWIRTAMNGVDGACAAADEPMSDGALAAVFRQMVADVECGRAFPNVQHMYSQSLFLGANTSVPQPVDLLLRLESLSDDVQTLKRAVGYNGDERCPLKQERAAAEKPRGAPAPNALRAVLAAAPELMQSICNVFIQDFLCLGYPLPDGCAVEPEAPAARQVSELGVRA